MTVEYVNFYAHRVPSLRISVENCGFDFHKQAESRFGTMPRQGHALSRHSEKSSEFSTGKLQQNAQYSASFLYLQRAD